MVFPPIALDGPCSDHQVVDQVESLVIHLRLLRLEPPGHGAAPELEAHGHDPEAEHYQSVYYAYLLCQEVAGKSVDEWGCEQYREDREASLDCKQVG